MAGRPL